jgi:hypothetical protein
MACCAFAAFLLVQLLVPFRALRARFGGRSRHDEAAVAWRPGTPTLAPAPGRPELRHRWMGALAGLMALELVVVAAYLSVAAPQWPGNSAASAGADWNALLALHTVWCGTDGAAASIDSIN